MSRYLYWAPLGIAVVCCGLWALRGRADNDAPDRSDKPRPKAERPTGSWEQTRDDQRIVLAFKGDRLQVSVTGKNTKKVWLMDADYSVTKDSILFGIVTSLDDKGLLRPEELRRRRIDDSGSKDDRPGGPGPGPGRGGEEGVAPIDVRLDDLFSFRFRVDDDVLTVKEMKLKGNADSFLQGRFKRQAEDAPREPKPREDEKDRNSKDKPSRPDVPPTDKP